MILLRVFFTKSYLGLSSLFFRKSWEDKNQGGEMLLGGSLRSPLGDLKPFIFFCWGCSLQYHLDEGWVLLSFLERVERLNYFTWFCWEYSLQNHIWVYLLFFLEKVERTKIEREWPLGGSLRSPLGYLKLFILFCWGCSLQYHLGEGWVLLFFRKSWEDKNRGWEIVSRGLTAFASGRLNNVY